MDIILAKYSKVNRISVCVCVCVSECVFDSELISVVSVACPPVAAEPGNRHRESGGKNAGTDTGPGRGKARSQGAGPRARVTEPVTSDPTAPGPDS